jgi:hypothetical protein
MKEGFASVDARFKAVDARFDKIDARFKAIDARFEAVDARFNARFDKIEETLSHHFKYMKNISLGLGRSLEAYTGGWLAEMLRSRGIENPESLIYQSYKCQKPGKGEGSESSEIEIDLFVKDPFIVAEVTSFLDEKELLKLYQLQENREFLESCFGKRAECYFACYDISKAIKEEAEAYAAKYDIKFVTNEMLEKYLKNRKKKRKEKK